MAVSAGAVGAIIVTLKVAGNLHWPAAGVKVNVTDPLKPAGLNVVPLTPDPLQVPVTPLWVLLKVTGVPV